LHQCNDNFVVGNLRLQWDLAKSRVNKRKHGVSLEQASQVFYDPLRISTNDRGDAGEERWQTLGMVDGILLLLVAHTLWEEQVGQEA
jgi:uncharacterized DUF497 family protein